MTGSTNSGSVFFAEVIPFKRSFVQVSLNLGSVMFNTLKITVDVLPKDITLGLVTGRGEYLCEKCSEFHQFYVIQLGFFFFTVNIMW